MIISNNIKTTDIQSMTRRIIYLILLFILTLGLLIVACGDNSTEPDNSVMTFEVTTFNNLAIDEYASNHEGSYYPITITLIDYELGSEFTGTVITSNIGLSSITGNCNVGPECFGVDLDSSYFPIEFLVFADLIIDNLQMKGRFAIAGSTLDTPSIEFSASREE